MRQIAFALVLAACAARAEEWLEAPTTMGGKIVLTKQTADWCPKGLLVGYIETSKQDAVYGCWTTSNERIHIKFNSGVVKVYDFEGWTYKTDGKK